ncbi:MAG: peptide chain release factor 2 [Parcubacteria group bacterium GW2011_GWA2_38_13b]|nr:MAG: peptide chain release factor 2 [Parcubacteria group bacterium GW2011_GWA2_38_13b]
MKKKVDDFEKEIVKPDFWNNTGYAQKVSEESADLKETLIFFGKIENEIAEIEELSALTNIDEDMMAELNEKARELEGKLRKEEIKIFLAGKNDRNDALVSIYAGAGGVDAQDWSGMLVKMYLKYFENNGYAVKIIDSSRGDEGGIKSIDIEVKGKYAYGYLKGEAGVHRLVRLSPFNAKHLRHTSFAKVEVLPMSESLKEIKINPEDIEIDTYRSSGPGGQNVNKVETAVRIHYLPTGIFVAAQSERSQAQNKEKALEILKLKIMQQVTEKEEEEKSAIRKSSGKAKWANQIRSYVLHPYKMVKDHRTNIETSDVKKVLDEGRLDQFIEAELKGLA